MGKFSTSRPDLPEVDEDVQPFFEDEGKWTGKQQATFEKLNTLMETPSDLSRSCAQYMLVVMNHRTDQMLMLRAGRAFRAELQNAGFSQEEIGSVIRYMEVNPGHSGVSSGPSA